LDQASAILDEIDGAYERALTGAAHGELACCEGDDEAGRELLTQALAALEQMGARPDAERVRARLGGACEA
jgi:hypothetical protein